MDSRHESLEQEILNELIESINIYILDNLDEIIVRDRLLEDMKDISRCIYNYAEMEIDVDEYLSKKNILSIDIVHLPKLNGETSRIFARKNDFAKIVADISSVVCVNNTEDYYYRMFKDEIHRLLRKYNSLNKASSSL